MDKARRQEHSLWESEGPRGVLSIQLVRRAYKDRRLQRAYDDVVRAFESGQRGWIAPMRHGLWNADGTRFFGSSGHCAFWHGFDGLELNGGRLLYGPGTHTRACYVAGRDVARFSNSATSRA